MSELLPISATIGDRTYRIKVEPHEEAQVRETLQVINNKIVELKSLYVGKDMQDYIAMTLLWFATQPPSTAATPSPDTANNQQLTQGLRLLEQLIDAELKNR
jgi:hypothetical protein